MAKDDYSADADNKQLEQALEVAEKDTKDASAGVMKDLRRFQSEKEEDLRRYMVSGYPCHYAWLCVSNLSNSTVFFFL
jgi:hypothetical protein